VNLKPFVPIGINRQNITKFKEIISSKESMISNSSSDDRLIVYTGPFTYLEIRNNTFKGKLYETEIQIDNFHKFIKQQLELANKKVENIRKKVSELLEEAMRKTTFNVNLIREQIKNFVTAKNELINEYEIQTKSKI
jgi:ElaB/YqjD/DUF883 family membrane-anchored ribosome-binding protein